METYKAPKNLTVKSENTLSPIFRDTAELTAHHSLSEKIQEAVKHSRFLIVLCSPASKASHWVNQEIQLFRKLHGEASILCVICEGTPETAFPPALLEGGREPLAANLSGGRESFNLGVTQLAASMLGVGLDQLIQRDAKRRRNRFRVLSAASLAFAAVMGGMAWTAMDARDAAEVSRSEAENMVEFMLTDLKQDLEPVGKLDILDDVGKRVSDYYQAIPFSDMDDDRLARQARARHLLGQVALDQGKMEKAKLEIEAAYQATQEVLRQNPDNTDAIFAHAQSAYWVGEMANIIQDYEITLKYWVEYDALGVRLYSINPNNLDWMMEAAWGQNNLGKVLGFINNHSQSLSHFENSLSIFAKIITLKPDDTVIALEKANVVAGQVKQLIMLGRDNEALISHSEELVILEKLYAKEPTNYFLLEDMLIINLAYIKLVLDVNNRCEASRLNAILIKYRDLLDNDPTQQVNVQTLLAYLDEFAIKCRDELSKDSMKSMLSYLQSRSFDFDIKPDGQIAHLVKLVEMP